MNFLFHISFERTNFVQETPNVPVQSDCVSLKEKILFLRSYFTKVGEKKVYAIKACAKSNHFLIPN
ncbi:hypothetical protein QR98_0080370 [Sarcoptes scabiei]|uniref:Uncharacterized protein n=1 Tax=Sarcoptes scabiei TaxID=52283 RepID=A0A132AGC8_SARSC|nr:hypothetical protein QR98_0080370 [Sarcoptes scabiei]